MGCYVCGSEKYIDILNKPEVRIWTNIGDIPHNRIGRYRCVLRQCTACGHVYQPIPDELNKILMDIYLSDNAQASTPTGKGNWGLERAEVFLNKINLQNYTSAIEIGCAGGYILRCLKQKGFKKLVGIEPSLRGTEKVDGILLLKEFADETLTLPQKYDFIFSNSAFEHIENINSVLNFCRKNLSKHGELFFTVPNAQVQLEEGDPALFLHQHIHYYTEHSLTCLLAKNGFKIKSLSSTKYSLDVSAKINANDNKDIPKMFFYQDYQSKLEKVLCKVESILQNGKVIIHGVNNSLNNMLTWINKEFDFTLVDNDKTKHSKKFFGRVVRPPAEIDMSTYKAALIVPVAFYDAIKSEYVQRGFNGAIENTLVDENLVKA